MYYTKTQYAQVLAARLWFRAKSIKSIAEDWEISVDEGRTTQIARNSARLLKRLSARTDRRKTFSNG